MNMMGMKAYAPKKIMIGKWLDGLILKPIERMIGYRLEGQMAHISGEKYVYS